MSLSLYWFVPSHGDGRSISRRNGADTAQRAPDLTYLTQVAGAAEQLGFAGLLVPFGMFCEDPWLVSAALAQHTDRVKFMVAMRPSLLSPMLAAQMAATGQRVTGNRIQLNIVTGGDPDEQARYGDWLAHEQRYQQTTEFLTILRGAWSGRPFDYSGEYFKVKGAVVRRLPDQLPPVFVGGSSVQAQQAAAALGDIFISWGEAPPQLRELFASVATLAAERGRQLACGSRFHVITRDSAADAWEVANGMLAGLDPAMVAAAQARMQRSESVGQRRVAVMHGGQAGNLEVYPNVWAGYGLIRPGPGAALVGSHEQVADRIAEYHGLGAEHLILSGQPHLEEAYWFGEGVMPLLRERGLLASEPPAGVMAGASHG